MITDTLPSGLDWLFFYFMLSTTDLGCPLTDKTRQWGWRGRRKRQRNIQKSKYKTTDAGEDSSRETQGEKGTRPKDLWGFSEGERCRQVLTCNSRRMKRWEVECWVTTEERSQEERMWNSTAKLNWGPVKERGDWSNLISRRRKKGKGKKKRKHTDAGKQKLQWDIRHERNGDQWERERESEEGGINAS